MDKAVMILSALGLNFFEPRAVEPPVVAGTPPQVPPNLQPLLEELRLAATGASFPRAEWYWTRTPDYRAKVVNDGEFRVFLRVVWTKNWFRVSIKEMGRSKISNSADLERLRETIQTAYNKADKYLQRAN